MTIAAPTQTSSILDDRFHSDRKYTTLRGITARARHHMSESTWDYLWVGTGDERTAERNTAKFDELLFETPLFAGVSNPDTTTSLFDLDLSFPLVTAPFGQEATFHPDGHLAIGRAAEAMGVRQMVPVAASYTLEEIAAASSAPVMYQMTLVGDEQLALDMANRAKAAGYRYLVATYSPIRQWRERLIENRFSSRLTRENVNFGPDASDPAGLQELIAFTEPRWTWAQAKSFISKSPLPVIVKGVQSAHDAEAALDAGAVGLYVSNYGGRTIDRTLSTIEVLPEVRAVAGPDVPIVFDSGIRRGSDIAAAVALGANAVAIGRITALGLAADGQAGVEAALQILREEFWMTMGHLGCSSVAELGPHVFRRTF
ncbi:alpha-hydroxy acid oxidase [Agromyces aerolatus]|uniref:alpha-hydroxy acid oxidase n=1 Tax=Agromyces sp. LY-1074 TaxID=3074080 RepID=UPI00286349F5|nr:MULTISPECIES: alpha-hydroxy acid oxidase [unclassified Agromyces]MDR5701396.1 alpha-hydroxy acid oxidase [Agromyces sp. LY-1074]MDR5706815.1 alpha-hydroxy acid oxidase [Agromyces sp. LY-1358]